MERERHLDILLQGVPRWNHWRRQSPGVRPQLRRASLRGLYLGEANLRDTDLSEADLSWSILILASLTYANLTDADLGDANLHGADLSWASLRGANLHGADLREANLSGADLVAANLRGADLSGADLNGTELVGANLSRANLTAANLAWTNLDGCFLERTVFGDVDLSLAKGLDLVRHLGPSTVGVDTLYRSAGRVPLGFLRGCGVPRAILAQVRALRESPPQYFSCSVFHSLKDRAFAEMLIEDLREGGVRAWPLTAEHVRGEPGWHNTDRRLGAYDKLVLVCSQSALVSATVDEELQRALGREAEGGGRVLYVASLDGYLQSAEREAPLWQHPLREALLAREPVDFAGWEADPLAYRAALRRLLAALHSAQPAPDSASDGH